MRRSFLGTALVAATLLAVPAEAQQLPRELETELALSGLPAHLRAGATAYVLGQAGFQIAQQGDNGFSCIVRREGVTPTHFEKSFIVVCYDAEGTRTLLKSDLEQARLFAQGKTHAEVAAVIESGWKAGRFEAPGKGISYMLSPVMRVQPVGGSPFSYIPHTMLYAAGLTPANIGMAMPPNPMGYLPFMAEPGQPWSMIVFPTHEAARTEISREFEGLLARMQEYLE